MRLLTRYVLKEITSHALLGVVFFTFVLFTRNVGQLLDLLVRATASPGLVGWLFLLVLPGVLTLTVPMAVLVGTLIGLSRMASDSEVTATRAAGLSIRTYLVPVSILALAGTAVSLYNAVSLAPRSVRALVGIENRLRTRQVSTEVHPRVFEERFPNTVLYVNDAPSGKNEWRGVFLADLQPGPGPITSTNAAEPTNAPAFGPKITVAERAQVLPDNAGNRLQLHLVSGSTHQVGGPGKVEDYLVSGFQESDLTIDLPSPPTARARPFTEQSSRALWQLPVENEEGRLARIEFHRRLAIPAASLVLALVAIPLGLSSRKGGKSMGVVLTLMLVLGYYLLLVFGISMARQGRLAPGAGVWLPDMVFLALGGFLLMRVERMRRGVSLTSRLMTWAKNLEQRWTHMDRVSYSAGRPVRRRFSFFPQLLDAYVVRGFVFYLLVFLAAFLLLMEMITFFDLINDIIRGQAPWLVISQYFYYLAPQLIYATAPLAVLVAVLVNFALLTKSNEVTAMKACGISLYRMSMPVLLVSAALSGALFLFDHFYLPEANRMQDSLRNQIKGRPPQTYLRPDRQWTLGQNGRIYYYNYFETTSNMMAGVTVFELDPQTFRLRRRITAARAQWQERVNVWVFEDGWVRDFKDTQLQGFRKFAAEAFTELDERPAYFKKEVKQSQQMNYPELRHYLDDLRQSGFDVVPLEVQLHKKLAFPFYPLVMALIGIPFSFTVGRRGALAGIAASMGIAIAYWTITVLFEKMGTINELPPALASWAPLALFGMGGLYMLLRVRT